jgi:hypothetical protein
MKLYTIDPDLVEPRWTELGLARLLSDGALVEVVPCEHGHTVPHRIFTRLSVAHDVWMQTGACPSNEAFELQEDTNLTPIEGVTLNEGDALRDALQEDTDERVRRNTLAALGNMLQEDK